MECKNKNYEDINNNILIEKCLKNEIELYYKKIEEIEKLKPEFNFKEFDTLFIINYIIYNMLEI